MQVLIQRQCLAVHDRSQMRPLIERDLPSTVKSDLGSSIVLVAHVRGGHIQAIALSYPDTQLVVGAIVLAVEQDLVADKHDDTGIDGHVEDTLRAAQLFPEKFTAVPLLADVVVSVPVVLAILRAAELTRRP